MTVSIDGFRPLYAMWSLAKPWTTWRLSQTCPEPKESEMASRLGDPPLLTDSDVDALAWQFFNSAYADDTYADWPLDRRLDGFLRRQGLSSVAEDGDAYDLVLNRVMAYIGAVSQPVRKAR
jgi:hypothetical protein